MREWLLDFIVCPACRGMLALRPAKLHLRRDSDDRRIEQGILSCAACKHHYPVIGAIPRLVPPEQLTDQERAAAERLARHKGPPEEETVSLLSEEEVRQRLERMERSRQQQLFGDNAYHRSRLKIRIAWAVEYAGKRTKHVRTVWPCLEQPITSIVEVGGGTGGYLSSFAAETGAQRGVLIEIQETPCEMALLRNPDTEVIRADAHALPFPDGAFDLVISSMVLEHLADWRRGALEMARVGRQSYISYSPNGAFPYDHGHVDAPVHAWMPRPVAVRVAYWFNRLRRTKRTLEAIRTVLGGLNLVPRRRLTRLLRRNGFASSPLFERLVRFSVREERPWKPMRAKRLLSRHPWVASWIARALVLLGAEPVVSLYIKTNRSPARAPADEVGAASA